MLELNKIHQGHTLELLKQIDNDSVDCIITSPPYYGLRAYPNSETIWDEPFLDAENKVLACSGHEWVIENKKLHAGRADTSGSADYIKNPLISKGKPYTINTCSKCGAWKGQLGLEPDYKLFLNHTLQITSELKRILKPTGTLWWNMGDTYAGSGNGFGGEGDPKLPEGRTGDLEPRKTGIPDKSLMQLPQRLSIRMVDEQSWILRNSIIWHKPNHMPSSVKDRLAGSYELVYFFVKNRKYYFDLDSIRIKTKHPPGLNQDFNIRVRDAAKGRIQEKWGPLAKASEHEVANYHEGSIKYLNLPNPQGFSRKRHKGYYGENGEYLSNPIGKNPGDIIEDFWTITTQPHPFAHFAVYPERLVEPMIKAGSPEGGIVLDPFSGSATTCLVAQKLKRQWIGLEINPDYIKIAEERLRPYVNQKRMLN